MGRADWDQILQKSCAGSSSKYSVRDGHFPQHDSLKSVGRQLRGRAKVCHSSRRLHKEPLARTNVIHPIEIAAACSELTCLLTLLLDYTSMPVTKNFHPPVLAPVQQLVRVNLPLPNVQHHSFENPC